MASGRKLHTVNGCFEKCQVLLTNRSKKMAKDIWGVGAVECRAVEVKWQR